MSGPRDNAGTLTSFWIGGVCVAWVSSDHAFNFHSDYLPGQRCTAHNLMSLGIWLKKVGVAMANIPTKIPYPDVVRL
jgi:hypothetical protein